MSEIVRSIRVRVDVETTKQTYALDREVESAQEAARVVAEWAHELDRE